MRSLLKCSQCGAMLPPGTTVCPRDGARAVEDNPFGDEATVRRDSVAPRANGKAASLPPSFLPTPIQIEPGAEVDPSSVDESEEQTSWEATVSRDILVGKQLGDFVVKRRIGAGGMGIVYAGEHPIIGRKVAIKILRPEFSEGGKARDLVAEARAASAIRHRGIIDIFGFGTIPHIGQYMVMEYLEGAPLDEVIAQRAPMLEAEVVALLDELLGALAAAHAMGVIHRDLKPGNIFVVRDSSGGESVKVLDFGLAKRSEVPHGTSPQTRASMIVGTPEYMAPEQATGSEVGPHTDLYSVGVIAFEMLTRRLPFQGASAMAIAIQHVQAKPPKVSDFVDVHPALNELVMRLLAKTAAQRPASAETARREVKAVARQLADGATRLEPSLNSDSTEPMQGARTARPAAPTPTRAAPKAARAEPDSATVTRTAPSSPQSDRTAPVSGPAEPYADATEPVSPALKPPTTERVVPVRRSRTPMIAVAGAVLVLAVLGLWALLRDKPPAPLPPPGNETPVIPSTVEPPTPPAGGAETPAPSGTGGPSTPTPPVADAKPDTPTPPEPTEQQVPIVPIPGETVKPPPPVRPAAKAKGTLKLVMVGGGWGQVFVDGKDVGRVPPANTHELTAGRHKLELKNNPLVQPYSAVITIAPGGTLEHEVRLKPLAPAPETP